MVYHKGGKMLTYLVKKSPEELKIIYSIYPRIKTWDGIEDLQESYISLEQELNGYIGKAFEGIVYDNKTYDTLYELVANINKPALTKFCMLRGISNEKIDVMTTKEYAFEIAEREGVKCYETFRKILPEVFGSYPSEYIILANYKHRCFMLTAYFLEVLRQMKKDKASSVEILKFLAATDNFNIDMNGPDMEFDPEIFSYLKGNCVFENKSIFNNIRLHITKKEQFKYPFIKHIINTQHSITTVSDDLLEYCNRTTNRLSKYITIKHEQFNIIFKRGYFKLIAEIFITKSTFSLSHVELMMPHILRGNMPKLPYDFNILELKYYNNDVSPEQFKRFYDLVEKTLPLFARNNGDRIDFINMFFNYHHLDKYSERRAELSAKIHGMYPDTYKIFDYLTIIHGYENADKLSAIFLDQIIMDYKIITLLNSQVIKLIKHISATNKKLPSQPIFHIIQHNINLKYFNDLILDLLPELVKNLTDIVFPEGFPDNLKLKIISLVLNN